MRRPLIVMLAALAGCDSGGEAPPDARFCPASMPSICAPECGPFEYYLYRHCMGGYRPGTYAITVTNAYYLPTTRDDGTPWDADGLPDPYVVVRYEGQHLGTTAHVDDTVTPTWEHTLPAVDFPHMNTLTFDVFDEDGGDDELMFACANVHADHSYPGWGRLLCDGEGITIAFTVASPGAPVGTETEPTRLVDTERALR